MTNSKIDNNFRSLLTAVDSTDTESPVRLEADASTGELLVKNINIDSTLQSLISYNVHTGYKELRVFNENHICVDNTSVLPLLANESFTGDWQDCINYQEVNISIDTDQNSATNGLSIQWSADAINVADTDVFTVYANKGTNYTPNSSFRYVRVVYTNGSVAQTRFNLMTILRRSVTGGSFHRISDTLKDDSDGRLNLSVLKLRTAHDNYISASATSNGNFKSAIEEFDTAVSTDTNKLNVVNYIVDESGVQRQTLSDGLFKGIPISIDIAHHEIHEGDSYNFCETILLGNGATQDYILTTPNTTKWSHFGYIIDFNDGAGTFEIYEGTNRVGTTLQSVFNRNRNSSNTNTSTVHKGQTDGTTDGTKICMRRAGSGKTLSGSAGSNMERVLKQNTKYLIRLTNNTTSNNNVSVEFDWYEHTNN